MYVYELAMVLNGLDVRVGGSLYFDVHALHKLVSSVYGLFVDCSLKKSV